MKKQYGRFLNELKAYELNKIPEAGNFEFLLKNKNVFIKIDQFGPSFAQIEPPSGMYILQRKVRETFSPWKFYFSIGAKVFNNFDIYSAKKISIIYYPHKATYELTFNQVKVMTDLFIDSEDSTMFMNVKFINLTNKALKIKVLGNITIDTLDSHMAVWDKTDWYSRTIIKNSKEPFFVLNHYSVDAKKEDRRFVGVAFSGVAKSVQISSELLRNSTKNFTKIPDKLGEVASQELTCFEQTMAANFEIELKDEFILKSVVYSSNDCEKVTESYVKSLLNDKVQHQVLENSKTRFADLFNSRTVTTNDKDFDAFVNTFLPLELGWVSDLDRGWATGMRGTRDCANDFMGYFGYDLEKVRGVITDLLNSVREEDGWFPRQVPVGGSKKYDMRPFSDSGAFAIELIYEYLSYSNDLSLMTDSFKYLESDKTGTGFEHLSKAVSYYANPNNINEEGLIKLNGGDWLDPLNRVGLKGRGGTLHVTCQAILAFKQYKEICVALGKGKEYYEKYEKQAKEFKKAIIKSCYLEDEQFYRALISDDGRWYFSNEDIDGYKRVYIPSNAYTIIAEVNPKNDKKVINTIKKYNETEKGFKLFTNPFGLKPFEGVGKLSSGDFQPYCLENGAVYNHGANLFLVRALAKMGDYKNLYKTINYALPYNKKFHPESESCLPAYAMTNVYNLSETFNGRSGLCFLTGSIAMVERAIYNWMFGIDFHMETLDIHPVLPKEYGDSKVDMKWNDKQLHFEFVGFGNKVLKCLLNNKEIVLNNGAVSINKKDLIKENLIKLVLE